ncbi:blue copper protein-like [Oryza glaberrima]|uniref:Phytocyanin domain-containing protein n=1 Tax=Oryza glaberrima TaxID=4538 RepID=I1R099_ORYGL|nr:blue copper protein-like [Oryza glaberrima]
MSYIVITMSIVVVVQFAAVFSMASATPAPSNATATTSHGRNTTAPPPPFGANHTVGEGAGWFFDGNANASVANYSAWAANRTFYLGDYLSFSTNTDNTVVHTTNATVYKLCGDGGAAAAAGCSGGGWKTEEAFLTVMLTAEGANYFFSDAGGGEHCRKGMRFELAVARGRGLPPVPASYYEPLSAAPPAAGCSSSMVVALAAGVAIAAILVL